MEKNKVRLLKLLMCSLAELRVILIHVVLHDYVYGSPREDTRPVGGRLYQSRGDSRPLEGGGRLYQPREDTRPVEAGGRLYQQRDDNRPVGGRVYQQRERRRSSLLATGG